MENDFMKGPPDETSAQTIARCRRGQKILRAKATLTKEEDEWLDFVTQKMDDWESDYDVQP